MKIWLQILFMFMCAGAVAQNEFAKWYFGRYAGLDFMTIPPTVITHTTLYTYEGSTSAADNAGNLLFYTDGETIWNKQQLVMANGTGLLGNGSTVQAALIAKQPGNANIYFVFTMDLQGWPNGLRYSLVDMSLAAGMGSVTVKNATITTPCTEQLTGVRHCNGVDLWIVTHDFSSNNFKSFLLTASGLNLTPVISSLGLAPPIFTPNNTVAGQGTIKISPNGKKLGLTFFNGSNNNEVALFDFDRSSGVISNYLSLITGTVGYYGCEFSGDGTKFYSGSSFNGFAGIHQWNLCAGSNSQVYASNITIANQQTSYGQFQLAPNGKIYIAHSPTQSLSVINNPDLPGTACNYSYMAQSVATGTSGMGLPNFIGGAYKNLPVFTFTLNPLSCSTVSFTAPPNPTVNLGCGASGYSVQGMSWNFGQPLTGPANTSTLNNPAHNFGTAGTYTVKQIFNYQCGADTVYQTITIPGPAISLITNVCAATATLNITGGVGPFTYTWLPSAQTTSVANVSTGSYTISINDNGNNCTYSTSAQITSSPAPTIAVQSVSICPKTSTTLTATGAANYTWAPGSTTGPTYTVAPTLTRVFTVTTTFTNGCSTNATATITVMNCNSIKEERYQQLILKVYPNPVTHVLFVENTEAIEIVIYDLAGREILNQKLESGTNTITLDLRGGMYFLRAVGKTGYAVEKIIKSD